MTIEEAILKAGYKDHGSDELYTTIYGKDDRESKFAIELFLDPLFWQSLSLASGWAYPKEWKGPRHPERGKKYAMELRHRFIDHLAEGKTAEEYFETLT